VYRACPNLSFPRHCDASRPAPEFVIKKPYDKGLWIKISRLSVFILFSRPRRRRAAAVLLMAPLFLMILQQAMGSLEDGFLTSFDRAGIAFQGPFVAFHLVFNLCLNVLVPLFA